VGLWDLMSPLEIVPVLVKITGSRGSGRIFAVGARSGVRIAYRSEPKKRKAVQNSLHSRKLFCISYLKKITLCHASDCFSITLPCRFKIAIQSGIGSVENQVTIPALA
jgi:hypothetical protein